MLTSYPIIIIIIIITIIVIIIITNTSRNIAHAANIRLYFSGGYLWYLVPIVENKIYGYDTETNRSFASNQVPDGTSVDVKEGINSLHVIPGTEVTLGDFTNTCLQDAAVCDSFSISFLVYIEATMASESDDLKVLYTKPTNTGPYQVEFTVKNVTSPNPEGHVSVASLNSAKLFERKGEFPGTNQWVHVVIVNSAEALELYINSSLVTNPTTIQPWMPSGSSGSQIQLVLGSTDNSNNIFLSYFQITKGNLSEQEIRQLEIESRKQGVWDQLHSGLGC